MRAIVGLVLIAGCYSPNPTAGGPCNIANECPAPLTCVQGICVPKGGGGSGVDAPIGGGPDADLTCSCSGSSLVCASGTTPCDQGCVTAGGAHCVMLTPSNGVDASATSALTQTITITGTTSFNADTGRITGGFARPSGTGVLGGVGYEQRMSGATPIAVFSFHALDIQSGAKVQFSGTRAVVFLVGTTATVAGEIDLSGCTGGSCPGPGGGAGTQYNTAAGGCGGGGGGATNNNDSSDSGGGGGAGGGNGAKGGDDFENNVLYPGGAGGTACIAATLEPLVGGSGGGGGGPGAVTGTRGGSGGGALQLTALQSITITGVIDAAGGGGAGGPADSLGSDAGAGGGGGAGGGILLEASTISLESSGILAANGGGGGGGAGGTAGGQAGAKGTRSTTPATGGMPGTTNGPGGAGAAAGIAPVAGGDQNDGNGGGGGGGVGVIYLRAGISSLSGTMSPLPGTAQL